MGLFTTPDGSICPFKSTEHGLSLKCIEKQCKLFIDGECGFVSIVKYVKQNTKED